MELILWSVQISNLFLSIEVIDVQQYRHVLFQVHAASTRTVVSPVPVPMVEGAALNLVVATPVPVLMATKVLAALMTQMNVQTRPLHARIKAFVLTPLAPTSEFTLISPEQCCTLNIFLKAMEWQVFSTSTEGINLMTWSVLLLQVHLYARVYW